MKLNIEKINWNENKKELSNLLKLLPKWRLEKALSYHFDIDKYLCTKSFLSLQKMLVEEYDLKTISQFSYTKNGKPYFKEHPDIHFNISHCKSGIACVVHNKPVGIDIEEIFFDESIAQNVLSKEELEIVQNSDYPEQEFIKYWTMKESYLKLTGIGIVDDMKNILHQYGNKVEFKTYSESSCITTVALNKIKE